MKPFRKAAKARRRTNSLRYPAFRVGLKGRGLSGEHIQLCAEGARRKPNLSGKRTETLERLITVFIGQSSFYVGLFFIWLDFEKEGHLYVRENSRFHRLCKQL